MQNTLQARMHAGPKSATPLTEEELRQQQQEEKNFFRLLQELTSRKKAKDYSVDALHVIAEVINLVPESYTAYNYRREVIVKLMDVSSSDAQKLLLAELKFNNTILEKDYKCYAAFAHRHWIYEQFLQLASKEGNRSPNEAEQTALISIVPLVHRLIKGELSQCDKLLKVDERNFHVWNHRRWVFTLSSRANNLLCCTLPPPGAAPASSSMSSPILSTGTSSSSMDSESFFTQDEQNDMNFTTKKITESFSNYSAWHQRSLIVQARMARFFKQIQLSEPGTASSPFSPQHLNVYRILAVEVELLCKAIYCDPNDQAAWCYAPFILDVYQQLQEPLAEAIRISGTVFLQSCTEGMQEEFQQHNGDLINVFVFAVLDLMEEQEKLDFSTSMAYSSSSTEEQKGSFLPHSFLLLFFVRLLQGKMCPTQLEGSRHVTAQDVQKVNSQRLLTFISWFRSKLLSTTNSHALAEKNESKNVDSSSSACSEVSDCLNWLCSRLVSRDPSRAGMYQYLRETACIACHRFYQLC